MIWGGVPDVTAAAVGATSSGGTTFNQSVLATTSPAATLVRRTTIPLQASATQVSSLIRQVGKLLTDTTSPLATLARQTAFPLQAIAGAAAFLSRSTSLPLKGTTAPLATLLLGSAFSRALQASASAIATLIALKAKLVSLQASAAATATLSRAIGKIVQAASSVVATIQGLNPMATALIDPIRPVTRQQGIQVPNVLSGPRWIDAITLSANTAASYTLPTDSAGAKATIFRLNCTTGPLYVNYNGTASVPSTTTNGTASAIYRTDLGPQMLQVPNSTDTISFFCGFNATLTIEAWS